MGLKIRFARHGQTKRPFYRIVVAESESRRDGRFIEVVGTHNPMTEPAQTTLQEDRIKHWVSVGAVPSRVARDLIEKQFPGMVAEREKRQLAKLQAARKARKERAKSRAAA